MTTFAPSAPTPAQIPFLSSLDREPAPRRLKPGAARWQQLTATEMVLLLMPEEGPDGWLAWVTNYAAHRDWWFFHDHDARRNEAGFPDLYLMRDRVVTAELKTETGKSRPAQVEYADRASQANAEHYLWRPRHKAEVLEVLR